MKLNVSNSGGSYKGPPSTGSTNAAEHHYFPQTSTDRPAKRKKKAAPKRRTSSEGYVSPFASLKAAVSGPSAMDMIMTQLPSPKIDYQKEAQKIYQPSLDYIDTQSKTAKTRGAANDKSLKNMFAGLASSIEGQTGEINQQYRTAKNTVDQGTKQGVQAVNKNYDDAALEQAAMLKRLGIEAAAPDTLKQGTEDEAFFKSLIQSGGNAAKTMLTQENTGALDFNRAQEGISRQSGADARAAGKLQLEDILAGLTGKKVDLKTTINQTAASMQSDAQKQQLEAQKQAMEALQADRNYGLQSQQLQFNMADAENDNMLGQARLALDTSQFESSQIDKDRQYQLALQKLASGGAAAKPVDPWGKGADLATKLYGGNQQAAGNAVAAVRDAIAAAGPEASTWKNPNDLVRAVLKRNPGANDVTQLTSLATYLFQNIFK